MSRMVEKHPDTDVEELRRLAYNNDGDDEDDDGDGDGDEDGGDNRREEISSQGWSTRASGFPYLNAL